MWTVCLCDITAVSAVMHSGVLCTLCVVVFYNLSAVQSKLSVKNHFVTFWTLLSFVLFHSELFLLFDVGEIKKLHVNK